MRTVIAVQNTTPVQVECVQKKLDTVQAQLRQSQAENDSLRTHLTQSQITNDQLRTQLNQVQTENTRLQTQLSAVETENSELKDELSESQDNKDKVVDQLSETQTENIELKVHLSGMQADYAVLEDHLKKFQADNASLKNELTQAQTQAEGKNWELKIYSLQKLERTQKSKASTKSHYAKLCEEWENSGLNLKNRIQDEVELRILHHKLSVSAKSLQQHQEMLEKCSKENAELQLNNRTLQHQLDNKEDYLKELTNKNQRSHSEASALSSYRRQSILYMQPSVKTSVSYSSTTSTSIPSEAPVVTTQSSSLEGLVTTVQPHSRISSRQLLDSSKLEEFPLQ